MNPLNLIPDNIPILTFNASTSTRASYRAFIQQIRATVGVPNHVLGIPELPQPPATETAANYFLIKLISFNYSVFLICRRSDLYLVAYATRDFSDIMFFSDTTIQVMRAVFTRTSRDRIHPVNMQASYDYITDKSEIHAVFWDFGMATMQDGIKNLADLGTTIDQRIISTSTLVFLLMISEPVRLVRLFELVSRYANNTHNVYKKFQLGVYHSVCIKNWGTLSEHAHASDPQTGVFKTPVILSGMMNPDDPSYAPPNDGIFNYREEISTVNHVRDIVAVLNARKEIPRV